MKIVWLADSVMLRQVLSRAQADDVSVQFARYTVVGTGAFAVDFGTLFVLTAWVGLYYLVSASIAFALGVATNYCLSISWVFARRTFEDKWWEFGIFLSVGAIGLGLTEVIMWFLTEQLAFHYLISKGVATIVVFLWNFVVRKLLLFR